MGGAGRYFDSSRAVDPVSVKMAIAAISRSSAECAMHSQIVSATDSRVVRAVGWGCGGGTRIWCLALGEVFAIRADGAMHSQIVSATDSRVVRAVGWRCGGSIRIWYSVSETILAIMATVSTG